jgi:hypothetical protein
MNASGSRRKFEAGFQTMVRRAAKMIEAFLLHAGANVMPAQTRMSQVVARVINPAPRIDALVFPGSIEQRNETATLAQLGVIRTSNRSAIEKKPAADVERQPRRSLQHGSFGVVAAIFQPGADVKVSFIYLTKQYFSGCRMWQSGDSDREFHHIFQVRSRLA